MALYSGFRFRLRAKIENEVKKVEKEKQMAGKSDGGGTCTLTRVTNRFVSEVWIILIITIITSLAVLFGAAVRDSVERTITGFLRWNLGTTVVDSPVKPISFYWIFSLFYLAIFVLVIVILRFMLQEAPPPTSAPTNFDPS